MAGLSLATLMWRCLLAFAAGFVVAEAWGWARDAARRAKRWLRDRRERRLVEARRLHCWQCSACSKIIIGFSSEQHDALCSARAVLPPWPVTEPEAVWFCWCGHAGKGSTRDHFTDDCADTRRRLLEREKHAAEMIAKHTEVVALARELSARLDGTLCRYCGATDERRLPIEHATGRCLSLAKEMPDAH